MSGYSYEIFNPYHVTLYKTHFQHPGFITFLLQKNYLLLLKLHIFDILQ